jgi:hypothetical protein
MVTNEHTVRETCCDPLRIGPPAPGGPPNPPPPSLKLTPLRKSSRSGGPPPLPSLSQPPPRLCTSTPLINGCRSNTLPGPPSSREDSLWLYACKSSCEHGSDTTTGEHVCVCLFVCLFSRCCACVLHTQVVSGSSHQSVCITPSLACTMLLAVI